MNEKQMKSYKRIEASEDMIAVAKDLVFTLEDLLAIGGEFKCHAEEFRQYDRPRHGGADSGVRPTANT